MTSRPHGMTVTMTALIGLTLGVAAPAALAQPCWVLSHQKISDTEGGFTGILDDSDYFGFSAASLGDLDGDGVGDLAVGAPYDDEGGENRGAVWVLLLNTDGTVKSHQKISDTEGGFTGDLDHSDYFGYSAASLGDLDGDGVGDLAVGAPYDDDGGENRGAVWVLLLNTDGTVKSHQKISDTEGGFTGDLDDDDHFGRSVASLGDLDGDGVADLAVSRGALWILFLNTDGTVKSHQEIIDPVTGLNLEFLGDLDGDGAGDLAVGMPLDDDGGYNRGAVWVLFLNTDGTVKAHQKISDTEGGFTGILDDADWFGSSAAALGDVDGDGVGDLAVGAHYDNDGGQDRGAVWVLFLNADGTVKWHQKISDTEGGFTGILDDWDNFGSSAAALGDLDGDGVGDLAVGARKDGDGGGWDRGAVWVLFLDGVSACPADIDGSGDVGFGDLLLVLFAWGGDGPEDINGSGEVDFQDILAILFAWGPCPQPGACCLPDGSCVLSGAGGSACASQGGVYHGDDTNCADVVCAQPGACCFADFTCEILLEELCLDAGGSFAGEGTICNIDCTKGACCLPDGSCMVVDLVVCDILTGDYQGNGIPCESVTCP